MNRTARTSPRLDPLPPEHAPELKAAGVVHLFLHGSYARGTAIRGSSDVDVIAEYPTCSKWPSQPPLQVRDDGFSGVGEISVVSKFRSLAFL